MLKKTLMALLLMYCIHGLAEEESVLEIDTQQEAQKRCIKSFMSDCLEKCDQTINDNCQSLCEKNAKDQCLYAGE